MNLKKEIVSQKAPAAIGPYSQAIEIGNTLYLSGQIPVDRKEGKITGNTIAEQTHQALQNIKFILEENNMTMKQVVKTTVLLSDINHFSEMNEVYAEYFSEPYPARAAFQVAALPMGALVEIESIAVKA
ncbi:RidA family protein [Jeotgalibaca sp. MA1X17-3]|uniref:RidA family protein n=1 Tax=Jeotgalibaca sp. MA1X17-3 TaxID=2908211 RepID=UPI001F36EDB7|nr:RidA family protein [Jeotgalibaca sp. MA1X17-3]UJF15546.1 RidA family protein [Jeotgalibaca sp. MA1X17-3]